jgi:deoxyribonuclease IV
MNRFTFPDSGDLLGAHVSTKGGLPTAFDRARAIDAAAIALFAKNSNQWKGKPQTEADCNAFSAARRSWSQGPVFTHASYLINLATTNPEFLSKSIAAMADELLRAEGLGAYAVVLHPGAHMGAGIAEGLDQIARSLDQIHRAIPDCRVITLLETAAGQGSCVGCTFEELRTILHAVDEPQRVGICFDTCHTFAAGYELRTRDGYERTMDELIAAFGLDNVGAFHLNDSKKGLGSRVDRHTHIGEGELGLEPFRFLLNDARFRRVPKVIETPKENENEEDIRNLATLRSLMN